MDCVLATKELDALAESEKAQEPAHEVLWSAGGYKSAHGREEHGVKRIVEPGIVDVSVWLSEVRDQEKEAQRSQHHGECPQRPSEPCGGDAGAHPTQSSLPFLCPFCHNTTLQHYRLPSVTATVTNEKIQGELPRIPIPRTPVNKGKRRAEIPQDPGPSLYPAPLYWPVNFSLALSISPFSSRSSSAAPAVASSWPGSDTAPICFIAPSRSYSGHSSTSLPLSSKRSIWMPLISIRSPLPGTPKNSPWWVPLAFQRLTTSFPSAIWSSTV